MLLAYPSWMLVVVPDFLFGIYSKKGASKVRGFDISPTMIEIAKKRVGDKAELFVGDLAFPIALEDACVDLVVSSLAIDYVRDWSKPLLEFRRLLRKNGRAVISVQHPLGSYAWFKPPSAFGVHYCEASWKGFTAEPVTVPDYYRSFAEIINPIITAGFKINSVHETKPVEALRDIDPRKYELGSKFPTFMVIDIARV